MQSDANGGRRRWYAGVLLVALGLIACGEDAPKGDGPDAGAAHGGGTGGVGGSAGTGGSGVAGSSIYPPKLECSEPLPDPGADACLACALEQCCWVGACFSPEAAVSRSGNRLDAPGLHGPRAPRPHQPNSAYGSVGNETPRCASGGEYAEQARAPPPLVRRCKQAGRDERGITRTNLSARRWLSRQRRRTMGSTHTTMLKATCAAAATPGERAARSVRP